MRNVVLIILVILFISCDGSKSSNKENKDVCNEILKKEIAVQNGVTIELQNDLKVLLKCHFDSVDCSILNNSDFLGYSLMTLGEMEH